MKTLLVALSVLTLASTVATTASAHHWRHCGWRHHHHMCW
jgi:hypothetical protein